MNLKTKNVHLIVCVMLLSVSLACNGQTRQQKSNAIISKLNLVENQKTIYEYTIASLKDLAIEKDKQPIIELESKVSEEEISKRIQSAINEVLSDKEIDDLYLFIQTSAFEKIFKTEEMYHVIATHFNDIDTEIERISQVFSGNGDESATASETSLNDRVDGFYAVIDNSYSSQGNDIQLEINPSLTTLDIMEVKKEYQKYNNKRPEISIELTKEGAEKFHAFTKSNIGKPIAIVIDHQVVSMPLIQMEITDGKISIMGMYSESEIDRMIEKLNMK